MSLSVAVLCTSRPHKSLIMMAVRSVEKDEGETISVVEVSPGELFIDSTDHDILIVHDGDFERNGLLIRRLARRKIEVLKVDGRSEDQIKIAVRETILDKRKAS